MLLLIGCLYLILMLPMTWLLCKLNVENKDLVELNEFFAGFLAVAWPVFLIAYIGTYFFRCLGKLVMYFAEVLGKLVQYFIRLTNKD